MSEVMAVAAGTELENTPGNPPEKLEVKLYPPPLACHDEVVANLALFMETLRHFHSSLGTRFMVPVIGGKELDLHLLYVEVTRRGGLEKAVTERKWKEVIAVFRFPPTTTSASFVLRKYYISLLHHYEQVYFFRLQGPLIPPTVALPVKRPPPCRPVPNNDLPESATDSIQQLTKTTKRTSPNLQHGAPVNFPVVGIIDGKFDHGYLVTVKLGTDLLRGVLYHPISGSSLPSMDKRDLQFNVSTGHSTFAAQSHDFRRRKKGWRKRDPAHPKPNRSAYNFFFAEKHSKLKILYPQREREFSKMIGESWNKLTQEERLIYQDSGLKDKERYKREMQEYKERLKLLLPVQGMNPPCSDSGPSVMADGSTN